MDRRIVGGALAALVAASSAFASTWIRYDLRRASTECPKICSGVVTSVAPQKLATAAFGEDGICTQVTVRVERRIKGMDAKAETFSFWVPGGTVGNEVRDVAGAPVFDVGDRYLLFFYESEGKYWPLWGGVSPIVRGVVLGQKSFTIEQNARLDDVIDEVGRVVAERQR